MGRSSGAGGIIAILAIIVIVALLLVTGIIKPSTPPPTAQLSIMPSSISVPNGQISSQSNPITIHLVNVQNANNTVFNIVLNSTNNTQAYPVYFNGTRITTISTSALIGVEPFTSQPFQVFGKLPQGVTSQVSYNITVRLYYKGTLLDRKALQVTVTPV